jgi:ABC-2 type transport system permease protein
VGNIWYLGMKELRGLLRDPVILVLVAYSFSGAIYSSATAQPESLNKAPIGIVDEDRSELSTRIVAAFLPPHFVKPVLVTPAEMDARLDRGLDTFGLYIPVSFQQDVLAGRSPAVQLNTDATRMAQAFAGTSDVQIILTTEVDAFLKGRRAASPELPVDLALRTRFNPNLIQSWFGAVTEFVFQVSMISMVLTGAALIREREHGTIEHLLVMPITPFEIMSSKIWSMGLVALAASVVSLRLVVRGVLGVPAAGSVVLFLIGTAAHLFATTSLGIFLATIGRTMPQFALLLVLVLVPMQVLSGGVTPYESMPTALQTLMLVAPTTHFIALAEAILFRGAGLSVVWKQYAALGAIGTVLFLLSLARFRKTIAAMA